MPILAQKLATPPFRGNKRNVAHSVRSPYAFAKSFFLAFTILQFFVFHATSSTSAMNNALPKPVRNEPCNVTPAAPEQGEKNADFGQKKPRQLVKEQFLTFFKATADRTSRSRKKHFEYMTLRLCPGIYLCTFEAPPPWNLNLIICNIFLCTYTKSQLPLFLKIVHAVSAWAPVLALALISVRRAKRPPSVPINHPHPRNLVR